MPKSLDLKSFLPDSLNAYVMPILSKKIIRSAYKKCSATRFLSFDLQVPQLEQPGTIFSPTVLNSVFSCSKNGSRVSNFIKSLPCVKFSFLVTRPCFGTTFNGRSCTLGCPLTYPCIHCAPKSESIGHSTLFPFYLGFTLIQTVYSY